MFCASCCIPIICRQIPKLGALGKKQCRGEAQPCPTPFSPIFYKLNKKYQTAYSVEMVWDEPHNPYLGKKVSEIEDKR